METTSCDVHHHGQQVDVMDGIPPAPSSIKVQMPELAKYLQDIAAQMGRETVALQVKATVDLRNAFDQDNYRAVNLVYRRGHGWVSWGENGFYFGVPEDAMRAFARRHREARA